MILLYDISCDNSPYSAANINAHTETTMSQIVRLLGYIHMKNS